MRNGRRVLFVTGAYAPEFSAGGLQCQAVARVLAARAQVAVMTTSTTHGLPAHDQVEDIAVTRVRVEPGNRWSAAGAVLRMGRELARLLPQVDVVHVQGFSNKNALIVAMARLFSR